MKAKDLKPIFGMFLVIVIGAAFMISIGNSNSPGTLAQLANNQTLDISTARMVGNGVNSTIILNLSFDFAHTGNSPVSNFVMRNATGTTLNSGNYTLNATLGTLVLVNNTAFIQQNSNTTFVDYNYFGSNYVDDAPTRNILALIPFFVALAILLAVIGYMNWAYIREWFGM